MNEGKVVRLERRLAQVEAIAAGLREQIAALREPSPKLGEGSEPAPVKKATRARKATKKATV